MSLISRAYRALFPYQLGYRCLLRNRKWELDFFRETSDPANYASPMPPVVAPWELPSGEYTELYPRVTVEREPLPTGAPEWARAAYFFRTLDHYGPYGVCRVPDAAVYGELGFVTLSGGELLKGLWRDLYDDLPFYWNSISRLAAAPERELRLRGTSALLAMPHAVNYYHFRLQCIPRAHLIARVIDLSDVDHWLVSPITSQFQRDLYAAAGVPEDKIVEIPEGTIVRADDLLVPSVPGEYGYVSDWAYAYTRSLVQPDPGTPRRERIFITRGAAVSRFMVNAKAVQRLVESEGYEPVQFDGLDVRHQAAVLEGARDIVAVHGAALANLVHCGPGTRLIELNPANYFTAFYNRLSRTAGVEYSTVLGTEARLVNQHYYPFQYSDMKVDLPKLRQAIRAERSSAAAG